MPCQIREEGSFLPGLPLQPVVLSTGDMGPSLCAGPLCRQSLLWGWLSLSQRCSPPPRHQPALLNLIPCLLCFLKEPSPHRSGSTFEGIVREALLGRGAKTYRRERAARRWSGRNSTPGRGDSSGAEDKGWALGRKQGGVGVGEGVEQKSRRV